jgi:hypothetical protein
MFNEALGDLFRRLRAGGAVRLFEADKPNDSARRLPICWGWESLVRIVVRVKGKFPLLETVGVGLTESAVDLNVAMRNSMRTGPRSKTLKTYCTSLIGRRAFVSHRMLRAIHFMREAVAHLKIGHSLIGPRRTDTAKPLRGPMDTKLVIQMMAAEIYRWGVVGSIAWL